MNEIGINNKQDTQKLYTLLLPYSIYDNPYKQYSRRIKLKKQSLVTTLQPSSTASEYMIFSPYWIPTTNIISSNTDNNEYINIKTRKKMKITSSINESGQLDIPKLPTPVEDETPTNIIILKPSEYEKITYSKYSLTELRSLCSHYNIKKSGTKTDLTQRIYTFLKQTYFIRRIQRKFKNFLSRKYGRLSGPGYLQSTKCVNDTDFYTFDKISNIKPTQLFTYRDTDNMIYGFHIASIFHLIVTSYPTITNPYNRNIISSLVIKNLYEKLIYGSLIGFRVSIKLDDDNQDDNESSELISENGQTLLRSSDSGSNNHILTREKQEELFIVDLFQHIDTLGNYSDSEWFMVLQRDELIRFIRHIHDIWYYRANLTQEMKERISPPNGNPFVLHNAHVNLNVITLLTAAELRTICVSIIERMTRRGLSREDQCLGAFYVLATLTIVNQDARNALPWLYEAVL
ncbi:hypothetical protein EBV26_17540 [bacterium]|nr:hypothetical protein [bacterium]